MLKNEKGITLIALIITIIVMLILVGVTINVALNGGLFTKAEDAASATEKDAIYEQIVSNMEITNDGKIAVKGTFEKVVQEIGEDKVTNINPATVDDSTTEVTFSIVGKTGIYNYKISTKSVEKDPVQTPGGIQPPAQTGGLVYGKVYSGALIEMMCFYPEYHIAILKEDFSDAAPYTYDEINGIVSVSGIDFKVLNDGKLLYAEIEETEITLELTEQEPKYKPTILGIGDLYTGIYYNNEIGMNICIAEDGNTVKVTIVKNNKGFGTNDLKILSDYGITIIDNKHLELDGKIYTLLEELK